MLIYKKRYLYCKIEIHSMDVCRKNSQKRMSCTQLEKTKISSLFKDVIHIRAVVRGSSRPAS